MIVHQDGAINLHRTVQHIHHLKKKAGVAINPATPASVLEEILPDADLILVMTVNPGFGGQQFIGTTVPKIARVRAMIKRVKPGRGVEVDGGIERHTATLTAAAGANVLVAGSAIFGAKDGVTAAMQRLAASVAR